MLRSHQPFLLVLEGGPGTISCNEIAKVWGSETNNYSMDRYFYYVYTFQVLILLISQITSVACEVIVIFDELFDEQGIHSYHHKINLIESW